jgi:hypothetical protein
VTITVWPSGLRGRTSAINVPFIPCGFGWKRKPLRRAQRSQWMRERPSRIFSRSRPCGADTPVRVGTEPTVALSLSLVILRQRSHWQSQGLQTKDPRIPPGLAGPPLFHCEMPTGLFSAPVPRLAPWAAFLRRSAAGSAVGGRLGHVRAAGARRPLQRAQGAGQP